MDIKSTPFTDRLPPEVADENENVEKGATPHPSPPLVVPSESLDLSVVDDPRDHNQQEMLPVLSLDVPRLNTTKVLKDEVVQLKSRVYRASQSVRIQFHFLNI